MTKAKAILFILGVSLFIIACHKGEEGFPKSEKDKFTTRFIFKSNWVGGLSNITINGNVYYPFENNYLSQNEYFSGTLDAEDSVFFEFYEPVYTDCKEQLTVSLSYYYQPVDTIPQWDSTGGTFVTPVSVISYENRDVVFNWPSDTNNARVK